MLLFSEKGDKIYKYKASKVFHSNGNGWDMTKILISNRVKDKVTGQPVYEDFAITVFADLAITQWNWKEKIKGDCIAIYGAKKVGIDTYKDHSKVELICDPEQIGIYKENSDEEVSNSQSNNNDENYLPF